MTIPRPVPTVDAHAATPPAPGEPAASPPAGKPLLPSLLITALTLFATYGGLIVILLPSQVALLDPDPEKKVVNLAIVTTTSFAFTLLAQPLAGALSDRTRSRFGRRAPFMVLGALVGAIFLFGIGSLKDLFWITVFWVLIQVSLNFVQAPLVTITADRFPRSKRGTASAMIGLGTQLGMTLGVMLGAALGSQLGIGYSTFGAAVLIAAVLFVIINRDWSSKDAAVEPFSWGAFFKGFWVNPRPSPGLRVGLRGPFPASR